MNTKILGLVFGFYSIQVDCQWSNWSSWGRCSKSCGSGQRKATRQVKQQAQNGGKSCQGSSSKTEVCNTKTCPTAPLKCKLLIYNLSSMRFD